MKNVLLSAALLLLLAGGYSCKGKEKDKTTETTTTAPTESNTPPAPSAPVEVAGDDALRQGVADATKDIKGLETRVENGVIYLSGTISKEDNMRIAPTLSSLNPKRIDREKLTVK